MDFAKKASVILCKVTVRQGRRLVRIARYFFAFLDYNKESRDSSFGVQALSGHIRDSGGIGMDGVDKPAAPVAKNFMEMWETSLDAALCVDVSYYLLDFVFFRKEMNPG